MDRFINFSLSALVRRLLFARVRPGSNPGVRSFFFVFFVNFPEKTNAAK